MAPSLEISEKRILEIYIVAKRRMNLWLSNSTFDEMTVMGSKIRFDMALGLYGGYPFEKPEWMKDTAFDRLNFNIMSKYILFGHFLLI